MQLHLAPMEGVIDQHMRQLLTSVGGIDVCVTEFVRVSKQQRLPDRVFTKLCPELLSGSRTVSGTPVKVQLLGGDPDSVAINAARAAHLGAHAIDLNFGCPAKTVNRNDGGASLLREPQRVYRIVAAVRRRVPSCIPVTAKIRLGFEDRSRYQDNALAVFEAGANSLTVHARSRADGYSPPAYWDCVGRIREQVKIPVVANGEIWTVADFLRCREVTGCSEFMLGRGILARPDLALAIKAAAEGVKFERYSWKQTASLLFHYYLTTNQAYPRRHLGNRVKQWLSYLRLSYPEADQLFEAIKRQKTEAAFEQAFARYADIDLRHLARLADELQSHNTITS